jgi:hypothetical protein
MANIKISQLSTASLLTGAELIELVQSGTNIQSTVANVRALSRVPTTVNYATTMSLSDTNDWNVYRILANGNFFLDVPTGTKDGSNVEAWITANGTSISMSINPAIKVPSNSSYANPYIISGSTKVKVLLQRDNTLNSGQWELTSLIGNY